ncbi:hypothetical protein [Pseudarthrobacter sp. MEB009]|uniref:hypothetical protein n=1 Tax=Pseudarthrobacter sp. MEB009 TaxID=3040326 RepID=UPI002555E6AB|nr:hypothetical protein [Pseudarthrobacter sp. MEB009]
MPATKLAKRRLSALAVFGALLLGQGVYSFAVEPEPYPTVRMPSFGAAPTRAGLFASRMAYVKVTYADGSTVNPRVSEIMDGVRFSAARPTLNYVFKPGKPVDDDTRLWLAARAKAVGGGSEPTSVEVCWQDAAVDVHDARVVNAKPCETTVVTF